jgi:hypothetical protein
LGEKHINSVPKIQKFETIINEVSSPKNMNHFGRSVEKKVFMFEKSERRLQSKTHNTQNLSLKNIENNGKNQCGVVQEAIPPPAADTMSKEDKKFVSKLLIAEVHFCRFLYKLSGQIKESCLTGLLKDSPCTNPVLQCFTQIIEQKVTRLRNFESHNFLDIGGEKYEEYRRTSDYRKLIKIAKDYYERYSTQLSNHWGGGLLEVSPFPHSMFHRCIEEVTKSIEYLLVGLQERSEGELGSHQEFLSNFSKDIVILDYLITCKQLLEMIEKEIRASGLENFEKFAKKSRIEEIVEGSTSEISPELFSKIIERGKYVVSVRRERL